jgi:hypothetical protein
MNSILGTIQSGFDAVTKPLPNGRNPEWARSNKLSIQWMGAFFNRNIKRYCFVYLQKT